MHVHKTKQGSCRKPTLLKSHLQASPNAAAFALSLLQHAWRDVHPSQTLHLLPVIQWQVDTCAYCHFQHLT